MTEFFKALNDFKPSPPDDNFYIEVVNTEIVSLCREANNNTVKNDTNYITSTNVAGCLFVNIIFLKVKHYIK